MADLSSIAKYITKGKESKAESIAKSAGHSIYGGSSGSSKSKPVAGFNIYDYITPGKEATADKIISAAGFSTNRTGATTIAGGAPITNSYYSTPITAGEMTTNTYIPTGANAPMPTPDFTNGYSVGALASMGQQNEPITTKPVSSTEDILQRMIGEQPERVDRQEIEKQAGLAKKEAEVRGIKSQIDMISAQTEAAKLSLVGQGRGIPETIIGGQQAQLDREAAIKLMPLTAQYQAAVENYTAAKEIVANYIADENAYLTRLQAWKDNIYDKAYNLAVGKEKDAVEEARIREDRAYEQIKYNNQLKQKIWEDSNYSLSGVLKLDPASPTFMQELAQFSGQIKIGNTATELTPRQNINLSSITTKYQADEIIKQAQSAITAKELANRLIQNPSDAGAQLTTLYTFIKALDPQSAVREGELSLVNSTQSYLSRFSNELNKIANNRAISPESATQLAKETINLADQWDKAARRRDNFYKSQANVLGVGSVFDEYLTGTKSAPTDNEVLQSGYSGQTSSGLNYTIE